MQLHHFIGLCIPLFLLLRFVSSKTLSLLLNTQPVLSFINFSSFQFISSQQATRMEDQRCDFPAIPRGPTVPDEDFFSLILQIQSKRINDQRVNFPGKK